MSDLKVRSQFLVRCTYKGCSFSDESASELFEAIGIAEAHLEEWVDEKNYEFKNDGHELEITEKKIVRKGY